MTDLEKNYQALIELKACPVAEISSYIYSFNLSFLLLPAHEKIKSMKNFYDWAGSEANPEPLKFYFAEFLLGFGYHLCDEHEAALHFLTSARRHFEEISDDVGVALCKVLTGNVYRTFGNFELSLTTCWEGYDVLKKSGQYPHFLCGCTHTMASVCYELHNYDEAEKWYKETYDLSDRVDFDYFRVYGLQGLGKVNMKQNELDEAKIYFEKALEVSKSSKVPSNIGTSLTELAFFYSHTGQYEEAEKLSKEALVLREQNHFTGGVITTCINLGELYIKQSKWAEALEVLNKVLTLAEEIKVKPKIYQIHLLLSELYQSNHDYEKSLYHHKLFYKIHEQVELEDNARKLSNAKLIFEAEQTRKENIIIKKQKQEIEQKNIELQETIDELTRAKIGRKARAITLIIAVVLFIFEDAILHFALTLVSTDNYLISLIIKMVIIFSLKPINTGVENYLLKKVMKRKKEKLLVVSEEALLQTGNL